MNDRQSAISWKSAFVLGGAYIATCIGSGFATGSELLQFFICYGVPGAIGAILISALLYYWLVGEFFRKGQELEPRWHKSIFIYYFGKRIGTLLDYYCAIFVGGCYIIMLSGAGTTLHEYWGWPVWLGSCAMALVAILTVMLGLRKMVKVIGTLGPLMAVVTILVGIAVLVKNGLHLSGVSAALPDMELMRIAPGWWMAGILYPCFSMLTLAPILPSMGATAPNKKTGRAAAAVGTVLFHGAIAVIVLALFSNLDQIGGRQVPNLALAGMLGSWVSVVFMVLVIIAIYTTACSMIWGFSAKFFRDEKSLRFRIGVLGLTVVGLVASYLFPLATLINFMFGISGYLGAAVAVGMVVSNLVKKKKISREAVPHEA